MLFKTHTLNKISTGEITIAFRKWKRPTIKEGGTLITRAGQLKILEIKPTDISSITEEEYRKAGIDDKEAFAKLISNKNEGQLHKVTFILKGPDPRLDLRKQDNLSEEEIEMLKNKLGKMDKNGKYGSWTEKVLLSIMKNPKKRAGDIALSLKVEKSWLKPQIRKLKNLGLTISHETGYEVSPRGRAYLQALN